MVAIETKTPQPQEPTAEGSEVSTLTPQELLDRRLGKLATEFVERFPVSRPELDPERIVDTSYPTASKWGKAAYEHTTYTNEPGGSPVSLPERAHAVSMFWTRKKMHPLGPRITSLHRGHDGIVPETGKSKLRYEVGDDGEPKRYGDVNGTLVPRVNGLKHLPKPLRGSVKKTEKLYAKLKKKQAKYDRKLKYSGLDDYLKATDAAPSNVERQLIEVPDVPVAAMVARGVAASVVTERAKRVGQRARNSRTGAAQLTAEADALESEARRVRESDELDGVEASYLRDVAQRLRELDEPDEARALELEALANKKDQDEAQAVELDSQAAEKYQKADKLGRKYRKQSAKRYKLQRKARIHRQTQIDHRNRTTMVDATADYTGTLAQAPEEPAETLEYTVELSPTAHLYKMVEDEVQVRAERELLRNEELRNEQLISKESRDRVYRRVRKEVRDEALGGLSASERQEYLEAFAALDKQASETRMKALQEKWPGAEQLWQQIEDQVQKQVNDEAADRRRTKESTKDAFKRIRGELIKQSIEAFGFANQESDEILEIFAHLDQKAFEQRQTERANAQRSGQQPRQRRSGRGSASTEAYPS